MEFGVIQSIEIGVNLESGENVRLAQVNVTGEDTVTVEMPFPEGDEFCPAVGDTVYYDEVDSGFLVARCIQSVMPVDETLTDGSRELFSRDGEDRSAKIRLNSDGTLVFNDGTDFAVRFNALESGLQNLLDKQNEILETVITHTHTVPLAMAGPTTLTSAVSVELAPVTAPTMDISGAKAEEIKL